MKIIGIAGGVIMPAIITVHMANTNANSIARQGECAGIMSPMPAGTNPEAGRVHATHDHVDREPQQVTPGHRDQ
jgi:hypothetical protein